MKLATYNPSVRLNAGGNARVVAPDVGAADMIGAKTMANVAAGIQNVGEQIDAVNVQAATNEYTKRLNEVLYNQDDGLMNTKYQGAEGITQKFEDAERKIREEVGGKYNFFSVKGNGVFNRMTNDSAAQRFEMVRRHQTQQYQAYKDVTYDNAMQLNIQTAADNYAMPDVVEQNINEALMSTRARLFGQGEEVVKAGERKAAGQIATQVINRAYASGDIDSAESYIEKYGQYMDPATVTGYAKNVYATKMATMQEVTAKTILSRFGDNEEAAYNYINSEEFGGNGNADGSITWFKDMSGKGENWGVNTCTKGVNAALQAGGYKPINTWAPDAWEEEKRAGRTFTDKNQLRNGDIVYWDSAGDKDASHVGIYDAKTGMVYQSGTSGFRPISLGAYPLIGFSHPQGKAASPEDRKKLFAAYQQAKALRDRFKMQEEKRILESAENEFFEMYRNGTTDPETLRAVAVQKAGDDPKMFARLTHMANSYAKVAGSVSSSSSSPGSRSNSKSDPLLEYKLTQMMNNGVSNTAVLDFLDNPENGFTDQDKKKALDVIEKRAKGTGQFAYNWDGIKAEVMGNYKASNKEYAWGNVQERLIYDINEYRAQHGGQDPDRATVAQWGRNVLAEGGVTYQVPGIWSSTKTVKSSEADAAAHGIMRVTDNPSGGKNIVLKNGDSIRVTDAQYARIIEQNMTVEQAINAG